MLVKPRFCIAQLGTNLADVLVNPLVGLIKFLLQPSVFTLQGSELLCCLSTLLLRFSLLDLGLSRVYLGVEATNLSGLRRTGALDLCHFFGHKLTMLCSLAV